MFQPLLRPLSTHGNAAGEKCGLTLTLEPGRPTGTADSPLELVGFRRGVHGRWIATRVRHELTGRGYLTLAVAEREVG